MKHIIAFFAALLLTSAAIAQDWHGHRHCVVQPDGRTICYHSGPFRPVNPWRFPPAIPGVWWRDPSPHNGFRWQPVGTEWVQVDYHDGLGFRWVELPRR